MYLLKFTLSVASLKETFYQNIFHIIGNLSYFPSQMDCQSSQQSASVASLDRVARARASPSDKNSFKSVCGSYPNAQMRINNNLWYGTCQCVC